MNKEQKQLIMKWFLMFLLFIFVLTIQKWIYEHVEILRAITGFIILLLSGTDIFERRRTPVNFQEIVDENPWIKLYLIGYCVYIAFSIFSGEDSSNSIIIGKLITLMLFLFFPFIIVTQKDKFNKT